MCDIIDEIGDDDDQILTMMCELRKLRRNRSELRKNLLKLVKSSKKNLPDVMFKRVECNLDKVMSSMSESYMMEPISVRWLKPLLYINK